MGPDKLLLKNIWYEHDNVKVFTYFFYEKTKKKYIF